MASSAETRHLRGIHLPRAPRPGSHPDSETVAVVGAVAFGLVLSFGLAIDAAFRLQKIEADRVESAFRPGIMTPAEIRSVLGRNLSVASQGEGEPLKAEFSERAQILELQDLGVEGSIPFTRQILDTQIQAQGAEPNVLIANGEVVLFSSEYIVEAESLKASHFTIVSGTRYEGLNGDAMVNGGGQPEVGLWAMPVDSLTGVPVDPKTNQPITEGQQPFFTPVDYLKLNIPAAAPERAIALF